MTLSLLMAGDVMLGRGLDQILPFPGSPELHEPHVRDARDYVRFAEELSGPLPRAVDSVYPWGDLRAEFSRVAGQINLVNLETALTTSDDFDRQKGIHYRANPGNVVCLTAARINCCMVANNHVLDWGRRGLEETLQTLDAAGVTHAGAGLTLEEAAAPAVLESSGKRILVFGIASVSSGIPTSWAATPDKPGVHLLETRPSWTDDLRRRLRDTKRPGDIALLSIHWGGNWGYEIPRAERELAHRLIGEAGIDVVHGHSSHHVQGIEVYQGRLILYGCGDLLNDYEGIGGHESYRPDLALLYLARVDPSGRLLGLRMTGARRHRFQLQRASDEDVAWLKECLNREGEELGTSVDANSDGSLGLRWTTE